MCALPDPVPTWLDVGTQGDGSACGNYASCDRWCPGGSSERHPYQKATAGQQVRTRTSEPPKNPGPGLQQPRSPPAGPGGLRACGRPRGGAPELGSPRGGPNPQKPLRGPSEALLPGCRENSCRHGAGLEARVPLSVCGPGLEPPAPSSLRATPAGYAPPRPAHLSSVRLRGATAHGRLSLRLRSDRGGGRVAVGQGEAAGPPWGAQSPSSKLPKDGEQRGCWSSEDAGTPTATALPTSLCSLASHLYFIPQGPPGTGPGLEPALFK